MLKLPLNEREVEMLTYLLRGHHFDYAGSAPHQSIISNFSSMREIDVMDTLLRLEQRGMVSMHRDIHTFYYAWLTPKGIVYAQTGG